MKTVWNNNWGLFGMKPYTDRIVRPPLYVALREFFAAGLTVVVVLIFCCDDLGADLCLALRCVAVGLFAFALWPPVNDILVARRNRQPLNLATVVLLLFIVAAIVVAIFYR